MIITDLPDDLLLNCLARVSRLNYPILSLVSKRFRSLIASPELYETRTLLGRTENFLYMCLGFNILPYHIPNVVPSPSEPKLRWFILTNPKPKPNSRWFTPCFRPYRITEKRSSDNLMAFSVPTRNFSPSFARSRVALGYNIYVIGEDVDNVSSSRVFFMDCRSHTWHEAPSKPITRKWDTVSVLDGKIYVLEGYTDPSCSDLIEVFDPRTQIWEHMPSPRAEIVGESLMILRSLALDGKLYVFGIDKSMVYKPQENKWDVVEENANLRWGAYIPCCVIDNVMYGTRSGVLKWYDSKGTSWRNLNGLEELPRLPEGLYEYNYVKLVNYKGKLAVLWSKKRPTIVFRKKIIWCAVIALERRNEQEDEQEVYGKIEWCDIVLTVPSSLSLLECLVVNV